MIPAPFDYVRPDSVPAAVGLLSRHGDDAKLLAGGHSLLPLMKLRLATPALLVDIGRLTDLSYVREQDGHVAVGALTTHHVLETSALLRRQVPLLAHVASVVGDPQVRHRGTIGGSLAHGDPAADLPTAVLALGGTLVARGPDGEREIAAADFFTGFLQVALQPVEMLVEVRLPCDDGSGWAYEKFTRRGNDWAIVAVAVSGDRVALANMASTPVRAAATERALADGADPSAAAELATEGAAPPADINGSREYRSHLARLLTRRALVTARSGRT